MGWRVQFSPDLRDEVAAGNVTVSVRLWRRPKVRVGGRYPVAGAYIEVTSLVFRIEFCLAESDA